MKAVIFILSALIVSSSEKSILYLSDILKETACDKITAVSTAGEARRLFIDNDFEICIINSPLRDEFGENLCYTISEKYTCQIIFIVKSDYFDEISNKVEDYGVITVAKPLNKALLWNSLKIAIASQKKMQLFQNENKKLFQKIEDIKIINRAKCTLISYLSMSEQEAHKYIEKQAMDMRLTRRAVAEKILKTYEN